MRVLEQVYELAQHPALADSPERAAALAIVANFALWSAEPARTLQLSEQLLGLAERVGDPQQLLIAHFLLGSARWLRGDLDAARRDLDEALALKGHYPHLTSDLPFGFDIGITSLARQACVLWLQGHPDQASCSLQEAVNAAQARGHPITLALTRGMAGMVLSVIGRDAVAARLQVDALRQLGAAGLFFEPWADSLAGRSSAEENQTEESLQQMRQGLAAFQMVGTPLGRAAQLVLLAQGYTRAGKVEAAMAALDQALAWMGQTGVCMLEAEAYRLRGELLLAGRFPGTEISDSAVGANSRSVFSPRDRRGPAAGGSVVGVARHGQPVPAAQGAEGSAGYRLRRSSPNAGGDLRLVHRGVRYSRTCARRGRCWQRPAKVKG